MSESNLWNALHGNMQKLFNWNAHRVETRNLPGFPDCIFNLPPYSTTGLIELKYITLPKRPSTPIDLTIRPKQSVFINQWGKSGGRIFLLAHLEFKPSQTTKPNTTKDHKQTSIYALFSSNVIHAIKRPQPLDTLLTHARKYWHNEIDYLHLKFLLEETQHSRPYYSVGNGFALPFAADTKAGQFSTHDQKGCAET